MSELPKIILLPRSYTENKHAEQVKCSLRFLINTSSSKWYTKITCDISVLQPDATKYSGLQRKRKLESLCRLIDFRRLPLLNDTVTELIISNVSCSNFSGIVEHKQVEQSHTGARIIDDIQITIREDPTRIYFPLYADCQAPMRDLMTVTKVRELAPGVYLASVEGGPTLYVYKEIERPLYDPTDTEVFLYELRNLETLRNIQGIVQLIAVVTSANPYQTHETQQGAGATVVRGFLLEHHPNGTLQDALLSLNSHRPWRQWALQLASSLQQMHDHTLTHMDIKPSNLIISANSRMILIDISGKAFSQDWLSPEMRDITDPLSQDFPSRVSNDIWAFGKVIARMANASCNVWEKKLLKGLSTHCTAPATQRISLHEAIAILETGAQEVYSLQSTSSALKPPFL